jgi:hypothetical protein
METEIPSNPNSVPVFPGAPRSRTDSPVTRLSIITVNYGSSGCLDGCLKSLKGALHRPGAEMLIYDNGPEDPRLAEILRGFSSARLVPGPRGVPFGAANNACARAARGEYLFFLNPDTIVKPGAVESLLAFAEGHEKCAAVGPRLSDADGRLEVSHAPDPGILTEAFVKLAKRLPGRFQSMLFGGRRSRRVDWVSGAAMMVRRSAFEEIGGFDEAFPLYFEDADLCRRLRDAGWEVRYCPEAEVIHHRGGAGTAAAPSASGLKYRQGQLRYYAKHRGRLENLLLRAYLRFRLPRWARALRDSSSRWPRGSWSPRGRGRFGA